MIDFDKLQWELNALNELLKDRQPGLALWNQFVAVRLENIAAIWKAANEAPVVIGDIYTAGPTYVIHPVEAFGIDVLSPVTWWACECGYSMPEKLSRCTKCGTEKGG